MAPALRRLKGILRLRELSRCKNKRLQRRLSRRSNRTEASPQPKSGELPVPLEAEMVVAEHWSKNPYPRTVAAGARVHIVERGDTLWDLAQRYYQNPFLWPQIWDANKYIPNAHWIYPGDPVIIPPLTPISEQMIAQEAQPGPPNLVKYLVDHRVPAPGIQLYPIALDVDLYCSGFIVPDTVVRKSKSLAMKKILTK